MKITLNGEIIETDSATLADLLVSHEYEVGAVATAVNGEFVAVVQREQTQLRADDTVEVIAPMSGG